jgi:hypothetical protein
MRPDPTLGSELERPLPFVRDLIGVGSAGPGSYPVGPEQPLAQAGMVRHTAACRARSAPRQGVAWVASKAPPFPGDEQRTGAVGRDHIVPRGQLGFVPVRVRRTARPPSQIRMTCQTGRAGNLYRRNPSRSGTPGPPAEVDAVVHLWPVT